jgi:hypothetical protein
MKLRKEFSKIHIILRKVSNYLKIFTLRKFGHYLSQLNVQIEGTFERKGN